MKSNSPAVLAVILTSVLASAPAFAAEFSGNVTITSDYSFRGVSQTTRDPAIQGGFDLETESGVYVGTWASNVNFGDDTSMEWDLYLGWAGDLTDTVSIDVNYVRFEYPSEGDALDYNEFGVSIGVTDFTFGLIYSDEYLAIDDVSWFYPYAEYSLSLPAESSLDFHVGLNVADDNSADDFESFFGDDQYVDWSVTYTIPVAGLDLGIGVVGTDIDDDFCDEACEPRAIVSVSKSL